MRNRVFLFLYILSFIVFFPQANFSAIFPPGVPGAIFTAEETEEMNRRLHFRILSGPFWTPSIDQVLMLERKVPLFLQSLEARAQLEVRRHLVLYKRQYFGITRSGVPVIMANFLCEQYWRFNDDWRSKIVVVTSSRRGTGDAYFRLFYDPRSGEFIELIVN